tara:strand:+ start:540 stop:1649 length:1110 start_codon:yes stop_codon:yes gene_type:complete
MLKNFFKKNIFISYIIIFLIFFIAVNKISKEFLQQNKLETRTVPDFLEKVYGKENIDDYQQVMSEQTTILDYKPFVEFTERQRINLFTSVSKLGNRCNKNNISKCDPPKGGKKEIWLFGGSTTFGYGVKNDETIAANLERQLDNQYRVINFGSGYYYSTQERILFNNLLLQLPAPHAAIFIDGVNDLGRAYNFDETINSNNIKYKLAKTSNDDIKDYFKERFYRLNIVRLISEFKSKKKKVHSTSNLSEAEISKLVNVLVNNQKINQAVGKMYNVKLVNILQPAPIYSDSYSTSRVPKEFLSTYIDKFDLKNVKLGYQIYLSKKYNLAINLSKLKIKEPMFIDMFHYSPEFNGAIAKVIISELESNNGN